MFECLHCHDALRLPVTYGCGHSACSSHNLDVCPKNCDDQQPLLANHDVTLSKVINLLEEEEPTGRPWGDDEGQDEEYERGEGSRPPSRQRRERRTSSPKFPLADELTCQICYMLLFEPVTTQCQHTFCKPCLQRSLDHSPTCPLCRTALSPIAPSHPNAHLLELIRTKFEEQYISRSSTQTPSHRLDTPLFVCQLCFPGLPTFLHFFEPRYKLMLRRALESPHPQFGMVMRANDMDYGTMLDIRSVQILDDGRSLVETFGTYRFRIMERATLDGYTVARVERIDDIALDLHTQPPLASLVQHCLAFLNHLHANSTPWVVQRLSNSYGSPPPYETALQNAAAFSFYVAMILPIDEGEKAKLLPIRSVTMRLTMCVWWIEGLRKEWWFDRGCVIS